MWLLLGCGEAAPKLSAEADTSISHAVPKRGAVSQNVYLYVHMVIHTNEDVVRGLVGCASRWVPLMREISVVRRTSDLLCITLSS